MKPYLIVIDLDGTLMLDFSHYDQETFDYIKKLSHEGHKIMLATGRPLRSSYFVYEALGLDTPLINYNGARVTNPKDPNYHTTDLRISRDDLLEIIDFTKDDLINVFCEIIDDIYVQEYNEFIHPFLHINSDFGKLHIGKLRDTLPDDPNGSLFFLKKGTIDRFVEHINNNYKGRLFPRYWEIDDNYIVEVCNPLVDKSVGFENACKYYNIPKVRTIAIGDGHNDIGMLDFAHIKVAMKNANPELFSHANYITERFDQQGVLKFLKSFFEE